MSDVKFQPPAYFEASRVPDSFLPVRFMDLGGRKLVVNEVGEHLVVDDATFDEFVAKKLRPGSVAYDDLKA